MIRFDLYGSVRVLRARIRKQIKRCFENFYRDLHRVFHRIMLLRLREFGDTTGASFIACRSFQMYMPPNKKRR